MEFPVPRLAVTRNSSHQFGEQGNGKGAPGKSGARCLANRGCALELETRADLDLPSGVGEVAVCVGHGLKR
jgi:hypothetical protein